MSLSPKSKRITLTNFIAILVTALLMWIYTTKKSYDQQASPTMLDTIKVAVDLSQESFGVDSLGKVSGRPKELLDLLLPERNFELLPYSNRCKALQDITEGKVQIYATPIPKSMAQTVTGAIATEWLYTSNFSLLYREDEEKDLEIRLADERPISITVSQDDPSAITLLENLAELNYPSLNINVSSLSPIDLGVQLAKGEINYLMCESSIASAILDLDSTILVSNEIGFQLQQVWLINNQLSELKEEIDSAIIAHRGSDEWLKIINDNK